MHYATVCKEIDNYLFINLLYSNDRKKHTIIIDSTSTSNNILPV